MNSMQQEPATATLNSSAKMTTATTPAGLWDLPALYLEVLARTEGLHFIVGPKLSGKTTALKQILFHIATNKKIVSIKDSSSWEPQINLSQADIIVMDHTNLHLFDRALEFAEMGYKVIVTLPFMNMQMGLERYLDLCGGNREIQQRRLSHVLKSCLGLRLMPGIESSIQGAFELMMATEGIRENLKAGNMNEIQNIVQSSGDRTGMRSMNQALLQLLIKRKIEWKVGFEMSPEPEALDGLLKKIGI